MDLSTKERPMLEELKKGKWPSFVTELEKSAAHADNAKDLIDLLEDSYERKIPLWKHGGIVTAVGL